MKYIKVLSLFDGISCARVALEQLGYKVDYYASEIDKYAIQIAQKNYKNTIQLGDITTINTPMLLTKDIDLIIGGSPCQDLSIAKNNRDGLKGKRSGLFYEYLRILKEVKPKYFILENVASMPKEAKEEISKQLGVEPIMINAALVSAQQRKRLFWTNIKGLILPEDRNIFLRDIVHEMRGEDFDLEKYIIKNINSTRIIKNLNEKSNALGIRSGSLGNSMQTSVRIGQIEKGGQGHRIYSVDGKSVALSANGGGGGAKTGLYLTEKDVVRKLTPIECERLQGLPDRYSEVNNDLQIENIYGKIKSLTNNDLTLWKNVLSKIAKEKKKQISVHVLCTTKDIKDMEVLNCQKNKSLKNVNIVIGWQSQEGCATNTIKIGIGTETHFTQIKLENITEKQLEVNTDICEILTENGGIETLLKNILGESSEEMKLFIISMLTNLITGLKTFIYAQEKNTCVFTTTLSKLLENYSKKELLILMVENISLVSNTQRYKALGNAFNVKIIKHILKKII